MPHATIVDPIAPTPTTKNPKAPSHVTHEGGKNQRYDTVVGGLGVVVAHRGPSGGGSLGSPDYREQ